VSTTSSHHSELSLNRAMVSRMRSDIPSQPHAIIRQIDGHVAASSHSPSCIITVAALSCAAEWQSCFLP
jgi:hypothetical protein